MVNLTYRRQFVIHRMYRRMTLAVWAAVVVAFVGARLMSERGRETERVVAAIVANAEEGGKIVLVSDGGGILSDAGEVGRGAGDGGLLFGGVFAVGGRLIAIDRARLHKAKDDMHHFKVAMRQLKGRKDLTDEQREEVKGME